MRGAQARRVARAAQQMGRLLTALDLGPGNGLSTLAARHLDRARIRELFQVRLDRASEQRRFRFVGAPRLASQRGVDLGREFQVQFSDPCIEKSSTFYHLG